MGKVQSIQRQFGERVRELRRRASLTQGELADRADMDSKYVSAIERGEKNVTLDLIARIARALALTPVQLFFFGDGEVRPAEKLAAAVLSERLEACSPELRELIGGVNGLLFEIVRQAGKKR